MKVRQSTIPTETMFFKDSDQVPQDLPSEPAGGEPLAKFPTEQNCTPDNNPHKRFDHYKTYCNIKKKSLIQILQPAQFRRHASPQPRLLKTDTLSAQSRQLRAAQVVRENSRNCVEATLDKILAKEQRHQAALSQLAEEQERRSQKHLVLSEKRRNVLEQLRAMRVQRETTSQLEYRKESVSKSIQLGSPPQSQPEFSKLILKRPQDSSRVDLIKQVSLKTSNQQKYSELVHAISPNVGKRLAKRKRFFRQPVQRFNQADRIRKLIIETSRRVSPQHSSERSPPRLHRQTEQPQQSTFETLAENSWRVAQKRRDYRKYVQMTVRRHSLQPNPDYS